jgi:hypothetical protein
MKKQFENETDWFESMTGDTFRRRRYFHAFQAHMKELDFDSQIQSLVGSTVIEQSIKLNPNPEDLKYAVITATKSTDGRAYTYSIVDLVAQTKEDSYCQFDNFQDLLINLSLHFKMGREDESVMQAVSLIIGGAKRRTDGNQG